MLRAEKQARKAQKAQWVKDNPNELSNWTAFWIIFIAFAIFFILVAILSAVT